MPLPAGVIIRPTTSDDVLALCGKRNTFTWRAWSVLLHGDLVCIAGLEMCRHNVIAFSKVKPDLSVSKMTIWRTAQELLALIMSASLSFIAIADPAVAGSFAFLRRLGLQHIGTSVHGEVFQCKQ